MNARYEGTIMVETADGLVVVDTTIRPKQGNMGSYPCMGWSMSIKKPVLRLPNSTGKCLHKIHLTAGL